jgi:hypothetical protein
MRWYHYMAYFFGGAFLANALPHLGNGISGHAFQSPFASPPGVGLSSAMVNVLWGFFNLALGYLLVCRVGSFDLRKIQHAFVFGAGILIISLLDAHAFRTAPRRIVIPPFFYDQTLASPSPRSWRLRGDNTCVGSLTPGADFNSYRARYNHADGQRHLSLVG